jgi:hypothetical protein
VRVAWRSVPLLACLGHQLHEVVAECRSPLLGKAGNGTLDGRNRRRDEPFRLVNPQQGGRFVAQLPHPFLELLPLAALAGFPLLSLRPLLPAMLSPASPEIAGSEQTPLVVGNVAPADRASGLARQEDSRPRSLGQDDSQVPTPERSALVCHRSFVFAA